MVSLWTFDEVKDLYLEQTGHAGDRSRAEARLWHKGLRAQWAVFGTTVQDLSDDVWEELCDAENEAAAIDRCRGAGFDIKPSTVKLSKTGSSIYL